MKKFLLMLLVAAPLFGAISNAKKYKLNQYMGQVGLETQIGTLIDEGGQLGLFKDGHQPHQIAVGSYNYSSQGGYANQPIFLGVSLPDKAIVTRSYIDIIEAPIGSGASIALYAESEYSEDVKGYTAIASWGIGFLEGKSTGSSTNFKKMTAERPLVMKVNGNTLTAGKFKVFLEYVMSE